MNKSNKDRLMEDVDSTISAYTKMIGASPQMAIAITDAVKIMVEAAYMTGRIDKHIEINEDLKK